MFLFVCKWCKFVNVGDFLCCFYEVRVSFYNWVEIRKNNLIKVMFMKKK